MIVSSGEKLSLRVESGGKVKMCLISEEEDEVSDGNKIIEALRAKN